MSRRRFLGTSSVLLAGALVPGLGSATSSTEAASTAATGAPSGDTPFRGVLNGLQVELSERTGGLRSLSYGHIGPLLRQDEGVAALLTLRYPVTGFVPMMLESRLSNARIVRADDGWSVNWDHLSGNRSDVELPAGRVSATVDIRSAPDGRSIILRARVENHSQGEIVEALFPDLSGLRPIDEPELMELRMALGVLNPLAGPVVTEGRSPFYAPDLWREYEAGGGYSRNALRWMDYGSLKGGFSLFEKAWITGEQPNILIHRNEADADELRVVWQHKTRVGPGEVWEREYWLTPHVGGWANGIEPFRDYVRKVNPPRKIPVPERIRNGLGCQTVWMMQSYECDPKYVAFRFSDLGRVARDAKAHGIDEIALWGWCHYGAFPITVMEELGTVDELLAGIREAREAGVHVAPFVSLKEIEDQFAAKYGLKPGSAAAWVYHPEMVPAMLPSNTPSKHVEVPSGNTAWQADVYASLTQWISRGVTCFTWDVFDDNGGMGLIDLIRRVREKVDTAAAGSFGGEVIRSFERAAQVLDYTWCWNDYLDAGPYTAALGYPRINTNIQSSARVTKMAFADNLYINAMPKWPNQPNGTKLIGEQADLSAALKQVATLRARFLEYFTDGDYLGDSFLFRPAARFIRKERSSDIGGGTDPGEFKYPPVMVRGYRLGNRMLVIVLNNENRARDVTLECDLPLWLPGARTCVIKTYDARGSHTQSHSWRAGTNWVGTMRDLRPLELGFFEVSSA